MDEFNYEEGFRYLLSVQESFKTLKLLYLNGKKTFKPETIKKLIEIRDEINRLIESLKD